MPRTCSSDMYSDMLKQLSAYSKEPGESGGSAAWRGRNVNTSSASGTCVELVPLVLKLSESNFGGSSMQGFCREFFAFLVSLSLEGEVGIPTLVEESQPWRGLGRLEASMPGRRGRVAQCHAV